MTPRLTSSYADEREIPNISATCETLKTICSVINPKSPFNVFLVRGDHPCTPWTATLYMDDNYENEFSVVSYWSGVTDTCARRTTMLFMILAIENKNQGFGLCPGAACGPTLDGAGRNPLARRTVDVSD